MEQEVREVRYLSLFSGIEACTVAWKPLGWEAVAFAEYEDFPKAVLAHHYPDVPNLGDVTKITEEMVANMGPINLVVGGTPCQNLSVAGNRKGLKGDQSSLFWELIRIFDIARRRNGARYLLWENVPGAFSSNGGHDFAYVLGAMVGRSVQVPPDGWKTAGLCVGADGLNMVEWRTLDAQFFGVPQRRRRIFALLDTGAWWSREPILLKQESGFGDSPEGQGKGQGASTGTREGSEGESVIYENHGNDSRITPNIGVSPTLHSRMGTGGNNVPLVMDDPKVYDMKQHHNPQESDTVQLTTENCSHIRGDSPLIKEKSFTPSSHGSYQEGVGTLRSAGGDIGGGSENLIVESHKVFNKQRIGEYSDEDIASTIAARDYKDSTDLVVEQKPICFLERAGKPGGWKGILMSEDKTFTLSTLDHMRVAHKEEPSNTVVRRLVPVEAERLQGFPDSYTDIPWAGKENSPDSRRYKALGNSMAVPVMRWIAESIDNAQEVHVDEDAIESILYNTDLEHGQLGLF